MSSILLADNGVSSGAAGLKSSADGTGTLALQTTTASGTATTAVLIDNAQNVGVGVTPSAWVSYEKSIDIGGAGNYGSLSSRGNYVSVGLNYYLNGSSVETYKNTNPAAKYTQSGGNHSWYTAASGTAGNAITFTQAMTLDASGKLLVGTTTASGNIATFKGSQQSFIIRNGVDSDYNEFGVWDGASDQCKAVIKNEGGLGKFGTRTNSSMVFQTNDTERARIDTSGNLLVGVTSTGGSTSGGFAVLPAGNQTYTTIGHVAGTSSGAYYHACYYNGSLVGGLTQSGTTGVVLTNLSDYRLKNNVLPMQDSLAKVLTLNPVCYKWKSDGSDGEGFIAHELQAVIPTAATGTQDEVDEEGNAKYQGINLSAIVPHLVKAIQEQQSLIQSLTDRLTALEGAAK